MEFNAAMCEMLHFGKSNQGKTFIVNGRAMKSVLEQKDISVQVHSSLKVASQVDCVVQVCDTLAFPRSQY